MTGDHRRDMCSNVRGIVKFSLVHLFDIAIWPAAG